MSSNKILQFEYIKRDLVFRFDAGTSRGVLKTKTVFWIKVFSGLNKNVVGWGEVAPLVKLSPDDRPDFEKVLDEVLKRLELETWELDEKSILDMVSELIPFHLPSIRFGVETAMLDLMNGGKKRIFKNDFFDLQKAIPINGLIWMGDEVFMKEQIDQKLEEGFNCIKMKIGAIDFRKELDLLAYIRSNFSPSVITLRVDANGAFNPEDALDKLNALDEFSLHSIEQPIAAGQHQEMRKLCETSPLPIALDEELIGVEGKGNLLDDILPPFLILKPSLLGGIKETREWIEEAEKRSIGWWMTSALESNIGLNAISQLTSQFRPTLPQGLGTGKLFHNNLRSPLTVEKGEILYHSDITWEDPS
ncbi:o-succinylbenzoate synthase [Algoriphagus aestuarii]|nr:o-succinylbenzoate synthase [Algoriphagus aestuarii]